MSIKLIYSQFLISQLGYLAIFHFNIIITLDGRQKIISLDNKYAEEEFRKLGFTDVP